MLAETQENGAAGLVLLMSGLRPARSSPVTTDTAFVRYLASLHVTKCLSTVPECGTLSAEHTGLPPNQILINSARFLDYLVAPLKKKKIKLGQDG